MVFWQEKWIILNSKLLDPGRPADPCVTRTKEGDPTRPDPWKFQNLLTRDPTRPVKICLTRPVTRPTRSSPTAEFAQMMNLLSRRKQ